jgi:DNA-binding transcriptional LysR family regulator
MSQSALSHAMKALEERLGVRLLSWTTRSVSTTEAGETLLRSLRPALEDIASGVDAVGALRGKPSGTVRVTATKHAVSSVVMPVLPGFLASPPDIRLDMIIDDKPDRYCRGTHRRWRRLRRYCRKGYDRSADRARHPDGRRRALSYFADHPTPRTPCDLAGHRCSNDRHIRSGGLYAWDFEEKGRPLRGSGRRASGIQ